MAFLFLTLFITIIISIITQHKNKCHYIFENYNKCDIDYINEDIYYFIPIPNIPTLITHNDIINLDKPYIDKSIMEVGDNFLKLEKPIIENTKPIINLELLENPIYQLPIEII